MERDERPMPCRKFYFSKPSSPVFFRGKRNQEDTAEIYILTCVIRTTGYGPTDKLCVLPDFQHPTFPFLSFSLPDSSVQFKNFSYKCSSISKKKKST